MTSRRRQMITNTVKFFDLLVMTVSLGVANLPVLFKVGLITFAQFFEIRIKLRNVFVFLLLLLVWNFIFTVLGLYNSKRLSRHLAEVVDVVKATSLGTFVITVLAILLKLQMTTPLFIVIFWLSTTVIAAGTRLILRAWLRSIRRQGRNSRNMLIIGTNRRAIEFAKTIQSHQELGYRVIGFSDQEWTGSRNLEQSQFCLLCGLAELPAFLRQNVVDEVVLALPIRTFHLHASRIAGLCEQQGILFRLLSDIFDLDSPKSAVEELGDAAFITHYTTAMDGWPLFMKRMLDITISLALLILLAFPLLVIAALIKLTAPGPVLFVQKRVGLNKRTFGIYKFRTMVVDAERRMREIEHLNEVSGPVFKIKNDPRLTPIGRFLRKTSIDELPQLLNILRGDMSLVGPRPLQLRDYELFTKDCEDWQRCRFSVRPGITCLWQVNGRSSLPFDKWMELDLEYIKKWSLWLDLKILARTIPAVLTGSGAA